MSLKCRARMGLRVALDRAANWPSGLRNGFKELETYRKSKGRENEVAAVVRPDCRFVAKFGKIPPMLGARFKWVYL